MEHPVKEIPQVIHNLTSTSPTSQKAALEAYFLPSASFRHPFCRVSSFENIRFPLLGEINSRWVILMIYRWYKILSPKIVLDVKSVGMIFYYVIATSLSPFDQKSQLLYVSIHQTFHIFFIPKIIYNAHVSLVTVLQLSHSQATNKYFIAGQEDLYQVNEFVKFFLPGGTLLIWLGQWMATLACIACSLLLTPFTWAEDAVMRTKRA